MYNTRITQSGKTKSNKSSRRGNDIVINVKSVNVDVIIDIKKQKYIRNRQPLKYDISKKYNFLNDHEYFTNHF